MSNARSGKTHARIALICCGVLLLAAAAAAAAQTTTRNGTLTSLDKDKATIQVRLQTT